LANSPDNLKFTDLYDQLKSSGLPFSVEKHSALYLRLESFLLQTFGEERVESEYLGDRVDGKPDGLGIMIYPGRMKVYVGQWRKGKRHGKGFMNYSLGERYVGDWEDDVRQGYGITVFEGRRTAVYYKEWKGQYQNDKWEGEAEIEEKARQRYPLREALESDDLKQIEKEIKRLEQNGETDAAFKLSAKLRAFESLHRGLYEIWEGFSTHYPSNYPNLNKTIHIKPVGVWCAECNKFIDRNSEGVSDLPEVDH